MSFKLGGVKITQVLLFSSLFAVEWHHNKNLLTQVSVFWGMSSRFEGGSKLQRHYFLFNIKHIFYFDFHQFAEEQMEGNK